MVRIRLPMQEVQVGSLGWQDPLEEGMVTHSSILAWKIPWLEEPGRLQSTGLQTVDQDRSCTSVGGGGEQGLSSPNFCT